MFPTMLVQSAMFPTIPVLPMVTPIFTRDQLILTLKLSHPMGMAMVMVMDTPMVTVLTTQSAMVTPTTTNTRDLLMLNPKLSLPMAMDMDMAMAILPPATTVRLTVMEAITTRQPGASLHFYVGRNMSAVQN